MPKTNNPLTKKNGLSINVVLTVVVVVVAVVVIGGVLLFGRGGNGAPNQAPNPGQPVAAELLRKPDSNMLSQAPDGKVTVVEFLDYQCPACHQYYAALTKKVEQDYEGRINFVTRNFPIAKAHPLANQAAQAAEAAGMQGKYKEMYHALYDNWQSWAVAPSGDNVSDDQQRAAKLFDQYAQQIGLDLNKFHQDMNSPQVKARIDRDTADGTKAGVHATPTIFINGKQFETPQGVTYQQLSDMFHGEIDKALK
ncbi:DsbA family protein [Saccharopolyspora rosea]|uniref:DsbA family protein n=1 Tax=Saccharopolyspora rosea TaxID=524884 RepID=UPI0021DA6105|nr:DsbA family protein [Saccharopolyspora rosea]